MSNNADDFDIDSGDDLAADPKEKKPGLKQVWDSNPMLKLGAVVVLAGGLYGAYATFVAPAEDAQENNSVVAEAVDVKQAPGEGEVDEAYRQALETENKERAESAAVTGDSAMPTPIGTAKDRLGASEGLSKPTEEDPLNEWRAAQDAKRLVIEQDEEEEAPEQADVVPMVQPVRPQPTVQANPDTMKALSEQMRAIVTAQAPKESALQVATKEIYATPETSYSLKVKKFKELEEKRKRLEAQKETKGDFTEARLPVAGSGEAGDGEANKASKGKPIVPAGNIAYAQLLNELNSDVPGPVLAAIHSGPFAGGRAIGKFEKKEEFLVLSFNRIVKDNVSYTMDGVALDPDSTLTGMQTDVDHHYMTRVILPAAADFIKGMAGAYAQTTTTVAVDTGTTTSSQSDLDTEQEIAKGIEKAAEGVSEILEEQSDRPITIKVAKGTPIGILFLNTVTTKSLEE